MSSNTNNLHCIVVTPEGVVLQQDIVSLKLHTIGGQIGIRKGHEPYATEVVSGDMSVEVAPGDIKHFYISDGFVTVNDDGHVDVLVDAVDEVSDGVSYDHVHRAHSKAQQKLDDSKKTESQYYADFQKRLAHQFKRLERFRN